MRRVVNLVIACGVLSGAVLLLAQDAPFTVKLDSNSISVEVLVTDSANRPVINLTKDDFSIYEDGKPQELVGYYSVDTTCSVLLLFDRSSSTKNEWPLLQTSLSHFVDTLRPQDRVSIATFTDKTILRLDWWNLSEGRPGDVLSDAKLENSTNFYGAINWALKKVQPLKTRKGIVVLTDGVDSMKTMHVFDPEQDQDFQKLRRNVRTGGVPIYFVALNTDLNSAHQTKEGRVRMEQLADASGGGILIPQNSAEVSQFFARIARGLDTQYGLAYQQPAASRDGKPHTIEVRLRERSLTIHQSRDRYTAN